MQRLIHALTIATAVGLATACAGPSPGETATAAGAGPGEPPATAASAPSTAGAPAATGGGSAAADDAATASTPAEGQAADATGHDGMAGMDDGDASAGSSGVQAGWYRDGAFQPCGRERSLKLSDTAQVEREIRAGGMQAGEPVYVRLSGESRDSVFQVNQVVQVGSPTPVRDCPMTGTVIQGS